MRLHDSDEAVAVVVPAVARAWMDDGDAGGDVTQGTTVFHAQQPPPIDIADYIARIVAFTGASRVVYVAALAYIARAIAGPYGAVMRLTSLNAHRMIFTASVLAAKFFDDQYMTNRYYATVGGISLAETNNLELSLLQALNWRCALSVEEFFDFEQQIIRIACLSSLGMSVRATLLKLGFTNVVFPPPPVIRICPPSDLPNEYTTSNLEDFCSQRPKDTRIVTKDMSPHNIDSAIVAWRYRCPIGSENIPIGNGTGPVGSAGNPAGNGISGPASHYGLSPTHVTPPSYDPFSWNTPWFAASCYAPPSSYQGQSHPASSVGRVIVS